MNIPEPFKDISKELAQRLSDPAIDTLFDLRERLYDAYESDEYGTIQDAEEDLVQHLEREGLVGAEVLVTGKLRPHEMCFADTWEDFLARRKLVSKWDDEGEYVYANGERLFMGALYEALLQSEEGYKNTRTISFFEYDDTVQTTDDLLTDIHDKIDDTAARKAHSLEVRQWVQDDSIPPDMVARLEDIEEIELLQPSVARIRQELEEEYVDEFEVLRTDLRTARNEYERISLLRDMQLTIQERTDYCYDTNQAIKVLETMINDEFKADTVPYLLTLHGEDDEYMQLTGTIRCIRLLQSVPENEVSEVRPVIETAVLLPGRNEGVIVGVIDPGCIVQVESLRPHKDEVFDFMAKIALRADGQQLDSMLTLPADSEVGVVPMAYTDKFSEVVEESYHSYGQQYREEVEMMHDSYDDRHEEYCRTLTDQAFARIAELVNVEYTDEEALLRAHVELQVLLQQLQVIANKYDYPALYVRVDARDITHHIPRQGLIKGSEEGASPVEFIILDQEHRPFDMVNGVIYDSVAEGTYDADAKNWRLKVAMIFEPVIGISYNISMPGAQVEVSPRMVIDDISRSNIISLQKARLDHAREVLQTIENLTANGLKTDEALRALSQHMCEVECRAQGNQVDIPPQLLAEVVDTVNEANAATVCESLSALLGSRVIMIDSDEYRTVIQAESVIQAEDGTLSVYGKQLADPEHRVDSIPVAQLDKAYISRFFQE